MSARTVVRLVLCALGLLTTGTPGTLATKHAPPSSPIVTAIAGDPVAAGLVTSLA
jgi:hypothetical protein